jgi:hypothetical protein
MASRRKRSAVPDLPVRTEAAEGQMSLGGGTLEVIASVEEDAMAARAAIPA